MLQLKNIVKNYSAGDSTVAALRGVSVSFRDREFVAVLGPSGCGKTTLLNIIGGLDQYTSGDPADLRPLDEGVPRPRLGRLPQPFYRLRLPEL